MELISLYTTIPTTYVSVFCKDVDLHVALCLCAMCKEPVRLPWLPFHLILSIRDVETSGRAKAANGS